MGETVNMLDNVNLREIKKISNSLTKDNIGDSLERAIVLQAAILNPSVRSEAIRELDKIRVFARQADYGWKSFNNPICSNCKLSEKQAWQLVTLVGTLHELLYCFDRVEETTFFTFANSTPVRFYVNGIFHYVSALFLLDWKKNKAKKLPHPGTVIKVLYPIGLSNLLDPIYEILDRRFGKELSYGETIRKNRNNHFVHGSFSPENIQDLVKDSNIFTESQKLRFLQNHWDLYDRLVILRLQIISLLTIQKVDFENFSPEKLYSLS